MQNAKKTPEVRRAQAAAQDDRDLRTALLANDDIGNFEDVAVRADEVSEGRIFGLDAVQRMVLSIVLFIVVTVVGIALLFATGTIVIR